MIVGIIGAGAAGMAAALSASENPNVNVIILERQSRVGRKLSATGNGRCNLTNIHTVPESYFGNDPGFAHCAISGFGAEDTLKWFEDLGLYTVTESTGKVYPYSDQANSVVDVLRLNLMRPNITLHTGFEVQRVKKTGDRFVLTDGAQEITCDRLIVACGGLAGSKLGGTMSGYKLLGKFGHKPTRLRPALVQLKSSWSALPGLKGIRANCHVEVIHDNSIFSQSTGELQFTDYGLSGPVIFEVSRDACALPGQWICRLDFLPDMPWAVLLDKLKQRTKTSLNVQELLTGIIHNRLGRVLLQAIGLQLSTECASLKDDDLQNVVNAVKGFEVSINEPMGMEQAQVTAGGVLTEQFDPETMESRLVSGLYACGEVLDIDGPCGGYNLQWAWSSGRLAGLSAGKESL